MNVKMERILKNMSDLISRSALYNALFLINGRVCPDTDVENFPITFNVKDVKRAILNAPTIEAAPVVHGEWIYENYTWHCGVCGFHPFKGYIPKEPGFNFCPNCGAKMDGGADQ